MRLATARVLRVCWSVTSSKIKLPKPRGTGTFRFLFFCIPPPKVDKKVDISRHLALPKVPLVDIEEVSIVILHHRLFTKQDLRTKLNNRPSTFINSGSSLYISTSSSIIQNHLCIIVYHLHSNFFKKHQNLILVGNLVSYQRRYNEVTKREGTLPKTK